MLEPYILTHSVNNVSFFLKIKQYLETNGKKNKNYFNDEKNQWVFNVISKWYDKKATFPRINELKIINSKLNKTDQEYKLLIDAVIDKTYSTDPSEVDVEYVEEETKSFIQENRLYEAMMLSQVDISEGNYGAISERMREAVTVNFDKDLGISIRDVSEGMEMMNELSSEATISTGLPSLDNALDGGYRGKELYIYSAVPGVGKCCFKDVSVSVTYEIDEETGEII